MLLRLYNDDTPLVDNSKDRFNKTRTEKSEPSSSGPAEASSMNESEAVIIEADVEDPNPKLNAEEATTAVAALEPGADEEKAMKDEDRILAAAQQKADDTKEIAPGVQDEEDVFNKTV